MANNSFRKRVESLLALADVQVDGDQPWYIQVHKPGFFRRVLAQGTIGAGKGCL